jgi:hypothetical protein
LSAYCGCASICSRSAMRVGLVSGGRSGRAGSFVSVALVSSRHRCGKNPVRPCPQLTEVSHEHATRPATMRRVDGHAVLPPSQDGRPSDRDRCVHRWMSPADPDTPLARAALRARPVHSTGAAAGLSLHRIVASRVRYSSCPPNAATARRVPADVVMVTTGVADACLSEESLGGAA